MPGITQPILYACKGIQEKEPSLGVKRGMLPRKSGILKTMVITITVLNTMPVAYLSGRLFSKINTMVIG